MESGPRLTDDAPRHRIVVVDDDEPTRKLLQRQLELAGYAVTAHADGSAALEAITRAGTGIVIADWSMPEMDGVELCRAVHELQQMQVVGQVYFILLTAHSAKDKVIEGLNAGANDYLTKPYHPGELLARVHVGQRMLGLQEELVQRTVEAQKANARMVVLANRLEQLANTDGLTQLPNRRCLFGRFQEAWDDSLREGSPLSLIMTDVDHFKRINDTHGHAAGDRVLEALGRVLQRHVPRPDLCGRFGGEEFVVICPATNGPAAALVAENLRREVAARPAVCGDAGIAVTISCGVAERAAYTPWPDDLVRAADAMLYAAKAHGRNQTWVLTCDGDGPPLGRRADDATITVPFTAGTGGSAHARGENRAARVECTHALPDHK